MAESSTLKPTNYEGATPSPMGNGSAAARGVANANRLSSSELLLRMLAVVTTLVAIIVTGISKQEKTVPMVVIPNLPPLNVEVVAKWQYSSAFVFFFVSNIIALVYGIVSLIVTLGNRGKSNGWGLAILLMDLVMAALLFSSNGAAAAIGLLGYKGNSHVRWNKVCNVFGKFCAHVAGSVVVSLMGSLAFLLLVALATISLYRIKSR
ncbi:hypothetical protein Scep_030591 [Stephania cephalantha]|uniref:CASP-like protein n=1 Tax=Stephania cephalantha TaxID=152367 RepID=A0AAP0HIR6_9MAGN